MDLWYEERRVPGTHRRELVKRIREVSQYGFKWVRLVRAETAQYLGHPDFPFWRFQLSNTQYPSILCPASGTDVTSSVPVKQ